MKRLLVLCLFLVACGDGGSSSGTAKAGDRATAAPSGVQVLLVDDGFEGADVQYVLHKDPLLAGEYTGDHGRRLANEVRRRTDAGLIGYVPFDETINVLLWPVSCFLNAPNCSNTPADLDAPVRWSADNGVQVALVRWGGCCFDDRHFASAEYAWQRGVIVVWPAGMDSLNLDYDNSPHMLVVGSGAAKSNYGNAVDVFVWRAGNSHSASRVAGWLAELYEELDPPATAEGAQMVLDEFYSRHI